MSGPTPEQKRRWIVDRTAWCDVCGERTTQGAPLVQAPDAASYPDFSICGPCLEDARLTLEAHHEAPPNPPEPSDYANYIEGAKAFNKLAAAFSRPDTEPGRLPAFMCTACRYVIVTPKGWTLERMNYNDASHANACPNCNAAPMGDRHTWTDAPPEPVGQ